MLLLLTIPHIPLLSVIDDCDALMLMMMNILGRQDDRPMRKP